MKKFTQCFFALIISCAVSPVHAQTATLVLYTIVAGDIVFERGNAND